MLSALRLGMNFSLATPAGYEPDAEIVAQAEALAAVSGGQLVITNDPSEAVAGAQAVYTDVWASMGQEHEKEQRLARLRSLSGERGAVRAGRSRSDLSALPAGQARRRGG